MRIGGHPVHPMLVHFPVAFWTVATAAYLAAAAGLDERAAGIANFSNGAGLIMAVFAVIAGLSELRRIEARSAAMRVATWHLMIMATAWFCFLLALLLATSAETAVERWAAQAGAAAGAGIGFILMAAGGWLGGRLVYEFGVGAKNEPKS
jgi:uncharacterized membrane protein